MQIIINPIIFSHFVVGLVILKIKPRETQRPMDGWIDRPLSLGVILRLCVCHYWKEAKKITIFKLGSKRLCFALLLFIVVVFGIAIELH